MKVHLLRDVNPRAISLVVKGANRKRFYMRKGEVAVEEDDSSATQLFDLPASHRLVKADDWSAVYCVVAEPDWEEKPGMLAKDQATPDIWADEEEIRKAAHRFMENGGLVNAMHASLDPYGTIVENFVAPADFNIDGDVIRKGSWCIAIKPNDAGRAAIERGEWTGISLEGEGLRVPMEKQGATTVYATEEDLAEAIEEFAKVEVATKPGVANVTPEDAKKLRPLADHYFGQAHPFTACVRDQVKHGLSELHANQRCAVLLDYFDPKRLRHSVRKASDADQGKVGGWMHEFLRKLGAANGLSDEDLAELDDAQTFTPEELIAADIPEQLEKSGGEAAAVAAMALTLDEVEQLELPDVELFKAARTFGAATRRKYAGSGVAMSDGSFPIPDTDALLRAQKAVGRAKPGKRAEVLAHIKRRAKALGATKLLSARFKKLDLPNEDAGSVEDEMGLTTEERETLDGLKSAVDALPEALSKSVGEAVAEALAKRTDEKPDNEKAEKVEKSDEDKDKPDDVTELRKAVDDLTGMVKALGEGRSAQPFDPEDPQTIAKADEYRREFEARGLPADLVGVVQS